MFRRIKNTLISQRKVIRASGRDTGDNMKLSRDKVTDMSHRIVEMLRKSHDLRLKHKDPTTCAWKSYAHDGAADGGRQGGPRRAREDQIAETRSPEGSEEWDLLHRRYYSEELKKLGIDLAR